MWLAEKAGAQTDTAPDIQIGRVTIAGAKPAVMLDGEIRNVAVAAPKNYAWFPAVGDEVLVLKTEGEWFIIAGAGSDANAAQGKTGIFSEGAGVSVGPESVTLSGEVNVCGAFKLNGVDIMSLIQSMGGN